MRLSRLLLVVCAIVLVVARSRVMAQAVVGQVFASDASVRGSVVLAQGGTNITSGSTVTAGESAALVRMNRGGELRICPSTSVSITASPNGRDLLLGLSDGAVETNYELANSADAIITPDFRLLLGGPGTAEIAFRVNTRGDACVRTSADSTAPLIIAEQNGDGLYQVKSGEQVFFRNGRVSNPEVSTAGDCGCPTPLPVLRAENKAGGPAASAATEQPATAPDAVRANGAGRPSTGSAAPPQPPPSPASPELNVQLEAPFVFRAGEAGPDLEDSIAHLRLTEGTKLPTPIVAPPPVQRAAAAAETTVAAPRQQAAKHKGLFGRVRSFFRSLFR